MRIQIVSDLHTEMRPEALAALPGWRDPQADLLVMAGDICNLDHLGFGAVVDATAGWRQVLYVPGNHEFYGTSPQEAFITVSQVMKQKFGGSLDVPFTVAMRPQFQEFCGTRFACGTMWYRKRDVAALPGAVPNIGRWHDRGRYRTFMDFKATDDLAPFCYDQNEEFEGMVRGELASTDVVVTHHLPSPQSVAEQFKRDPDNCFFVCDVEDVILARQPQLWLHGHTHTPFDYRIHDTRVVCNPLGYRGERGVDAYKPLTLDIP